MTPRGVEVEWEDPPERVRKGGLDKWGQRLATVREGGGKWACVLRNYSQCGIATNTLTQRSDLPWVEYEVTARRTVDGKYDIYMRWVGES